MGFFSKNKKEEVVVLFDVGPGSVGGSMILSSENSRPTILSTYRKSFKIREKIDGNILIKEMLEAVKDVAVHLQNKTHMNPKKVYTIISSPWSTASLQKIKRNHTENFLFTEKYAKEIIATEIDQFKKENRDFDELIDKRALKVLLNGYEIENPHGKRAKEIEIDLFLSLASSEVISSIENVVRGVYHKKIKFTSQMFADFVVVRDIFDNLNDFIILNIDEETTEISVMKNDILAGTSSIPYGKNTIIRDISKELGKDISETKSLLSLQNSSHLHEKYSKEISIAIQNSNKKWIGGVKKVFNSFFVDMFVPHNIFLISDQNMEKWFSGLLNKRNFPELTLTEDSFNVTIGNDRIFNEFVEFSLNLKKDTNLTMQSIFINKINFL